MHGCLMPVVVALLLIVQAAPPVLSRGDLSETNSTNVCTGIFDFYMVLDSSGSVKEHFHSEMVPFVRNIALHYAEPNFRMAIVTFASIAKVHLNLTRIANGDSIETGMRSLNEHRVGGKTNLGPALFDVNNLIDSFGGDRASIVLVITDGQLQDVTEATHQSRIAQSKGSTIFAIGVGNNTHFNELNAITGRGDHVSIGNDFNFLDQILNKVVNDTCIEITSATPSTVCAGSNNDIILSGRGFTNQLVKDRATCRFKSANGWVYTTRPTETISYERIVCPSPQNITSTLQVQVTTNGVSFISSNITVNVSSCYDRQAGSDSGSSSSAGGLIAGTVIVIILFPVFLFLLWYIFPLMTCKVEGGLPPEKKEQSPRGRGTPGRTWEVVDASYYGGRGAGGIRPMTVKWGEKGATEMGEKLKKAKEANVITVKRKPSRPAPPRPPHKKTGCCQTAKAKFTSWYTALASYRPVFILHGSRRKILWCRSKSKYLPKNTAVLV